MSDEPVMHFHSTYDGGWDFECTLHELVFQLLDE